jgi:hypothetical protein
MGTFIFLLDPLQKSSQEPEIQKEQRGGFVGHQNPLETLTIPAIILNF